MQVCSWFVPKGASVWSCCRQPLKLSWTQTRTSLWSVTPADVLRYLSISSGVFRVESRICLSPQVCWGWSQVTWRLPQGSEIDRVVVENRGSSSVLQLFNVTWRNSGRYTCEEASAFQSREIDIFIPGQGENIHYLLIHIWPSCETCLSWYVHLPHLVLRSRWMVRPIGASCGDEGGRGRYHPLRGVRPTAQCLTVWTSRQDAGYWDDIWARPRLHRSSEWHVIRVLGHPRRRGEGVQGLLRLQHFRWVN